MSDTYYGTQGGGTAVLDNGEIVWQTPPNDSEFRAGEVVPREWDITGPFSTKTNEFVG